EKTRQQKRELNDFAHLESGCDCAAHYGKPEQGDDHSDDHVRPRVHLHFAQGDPLILLNDRLQIVHRLTDRILVAVAIARTPTVSGSASWVSNSHIATFGLAGRIVPRSRLSPTGVHNPKTPAAPVWKLAQKFVGGSP